MLLLHAESQNNSLDILFPRVISWLEGCETLAMQGGAVQPHDLVVLRGGLLQIRFLSGATPLWSRLQWSWEQVQVVIAEMSSFQHT